MRIAWSRLHSAAIVGPAALGLALAPAAAMAAPGAAPSASSASWHIEKTFALDTTIFSVSGVTASDAWLAGQSATFGLLVQHWNGQSWGSVATPASLNGNGSRDCAGPAREVRGVERPGSAKLGNFANRAELQIGRAGISGGLGERVFDGFLAGLVQIFFGF